MSRCRAYVNSDTDITRDRTQKPTTHDPAKARISAGPSGSTSAPATAERMDAKTQANPPSTVAKAGIRLRGLGQVGLPGSALLFICI